MENASKALIIAGAILLSILIIAIGMYIYTSSQSTITGAMTDMSTQEIQAFNSNWETYQGSRNGSEVKAMIGKLQANAKTYSDEPGKVPNILINKLYSADGIQENTVGEASNYQIPFNRADSTGNSSLANYIACLSFVSNHVELKHQYTVTTTVGTSGLIERISICYKAGFELTGNPTDTEANGATTGTVTGWPTATGGTT